MAYTLSPSALNLMQDCSRCFWLDKHTIWKRPFGIFPTLPSGMDRILKKHFDCFMKKGILPPELAEDPQCEDTHLFDNEALLKTWQNNFKGISWTDEHGNTLQGAVDNILVKDNKLIVLDYKTRGYPIKESTAEHYRLQQNIYAHLLERNGYAIQNYFFLLFYIPSKVTETGEVIFDTSLVKMHVDVSMAERAWNRALDILSGPCPTKTCPWCVNVEQPSN